MPRPPNPRTYDEITRSTVPEPDSSFRPTVEQERAAFEGERVMSADERALYEHVSEALRTSGVDVSNVAIEIDRTQVTLRGRVSDYHMLPKLENAVRSVPDVGDIVDYVVVDPEA